MHERNCLMGSFAMCCFLHTYYYFFPENSSHQKSVCSKNSSAAFCYVCCSTSNDFFSDFESGDLIKAMCNCALSNQSAHDSVFPTQKGKSFVIENFEKGKFHLVSYKHNLVGFCSLCLLSISQSWQHWHTHRSKRGLFFSFLTPPFYYTFTIGP